MWPASSCVSCTSPHHLRRVPGRHIIRSAGYRRGEAIVIRRARKPTTRAGHDGYYCPLPTPYLIGPLSMAAPRFVFHSSDPVRASRAWKYPSRPPVNSRSEPVVRLPLSVTSVIVNFHFPRPVAGSSAITAELDGVARGARPGRSPINTWTEAAGHGAVIALDPATGREKWKFTMTDVTDSGILTTGSDLLFTGGREGYFQALDARTGSLLWKTNLGAAVNSGPISYRVGNRQDVSIVSGLGLFVFALDE